MSGTYIASDASAVAMLQLVETPDGRLQGQFQLASLSPDGRFASRTFSVAGTTNEGKLSLAGDGMANLFGSVSGNHLLLNGAAQFGTTDFGSGEPSQFQAAFLALHQRSERLLAEEADRKARELAEAEEKRFQQAAASLLSDLTAFNNGQALRMQKIAATTKTFSPITSEMEEYLERERSLAGQANLLARSNLSLAVNRGQLAAYSAHNGFQVAAIDLNGRVLRLAQRLTDASSHCASPKQQPIPASIADTESHAQTCEKLSAIGGEFLVNKDAASKALNAVEATYQEEETKQSRLVSEASRSVR